MFIIVPIPAIEMLPYYKNALKLSDETKSSKKNDFRFLCLHV